MAPPAIQAARTSAPEGSRCATSDGLMKMPAPMIPPITTTVASKRPSSPRRLKPPSPPGGPHGAEPLDAPRHASPHDPLAPAQGLHVRGPIGGHDQEIGVLALLDRAEVLLAPHGPRAPARRGHQDLHRGHAGRLH